ncbi:unnamed protein product [Scytosiphon promiscuus]
MMSAFFFGGGGYVGPGKRRQALLMLIRKDPADQVEVQDNPPVGRALIVDPSLHSYLLPLLCCLLSCLHLNPLENGIAKRSSYFDEHLSDHVYALSEGVIVASVVF